MEFGHFSHYSFFDKVPAHGFPVSEFNGAFLELTLFAFPPSTSLEAEAAETEAKNFNDFSRANNVFCKKEAKTQPVQVGRAFQTW